MIRSITCIDLETTGENPPEAAPCEVGVAYLFADKTDLAGSPTGWRLDSWDSWFVDPGVPITAETAAIHHILDADVRGAEPWRESLSNVGQNPATMCFAAHGVDNEKKWLTPDITPDRPWLCTYRCALRLWPDAPRHSLQVLRYWLDPVGLKREEALPAHRAGPDAYVTAFIVLEMLNMASLEQLLDWTTKPALLAYWPFGEHRGKPVREIETSLLEWTLRKDFGEDIMFTARTELERREEEMRKEREAEPYSANDDDGPF
jgi:exodeoxyribonuclease X